MKKIIVFFICCQILFSCSKHHEPPDPQQATGILYFVDPAVDGIGLFFQTSVDSEYIYFYTESGDQFSNYEGFKNSIGLHLKMTFIDEGRRGCPFCENITGTQRRIVKLIRLEKE